MEAIYYHLTLYPISQNLSCFLHFQLILTSFPFQLILISISIFISWFSAKDIAQLTKLSLVNKLNNQESTKKNFTILSSKNTIPISKTSLYSFPNWTSLNRLYDGYVHLRRANSITNHSLHSTLVNILLPSNTQTFLIPPHSWLQSIQLRKTMQSVALDYNVYHASCQCCSVSDSHRLISLHSQSIHFQIYHIVYCYHLILKLFL